MGCVKLGAGWGLAWLSFLGVAQLPIPMTKVRSTSPNKKEIFRIEASWIIVCPYCIRYEKREAMKKMKFSFFHSLSYIFYFLKASVRGGTICFLRDRTPGIWK